MEFLADFSFDTAVSGLLCILLVGVILLALRLDARLKTVRDSSGELHSLIKGLNEATERAYQAVAQMSAAARENKGTLDTSIMKARDLSDELSLITQSADSLASRLSQNTAPNIPQERLLARDRQAPKSPTAPVAQSVEEDDPRDMLKKIIAGVR